MTGMTVVSIVDGDDCDEDEDAVGVGKSGCVGAGVDGDGGGNGSGGRGDEDDAFHGCWGDCDCVAMIIDFASRFPPRLLEAET